MSRKLAIAAFLFGFVAIFNVTPVLAVVSRSIVTPLPSPSPEGITATNEQEGTQPVLDASPSAQEQQQLEQIKKQDITNPEETQDKSDFLKLFERRPISKLTPFNFIAYTVQFAVGVGVPANTIMLILLLPFLATIIAFFRHFIGLPSLDMLVPIALSVTLVSTGLTAGAILLVSIILASTMGRIILKRIRIMQLPKKALSVLVVAVFVFLALMISASNGILIVKQLSIFPILILILLGERIIAVQLARSLKETVVVTGVTLVLGILGYLILTSGTMRQNLLLYPELIIILVPVNIMIGRYFGLRLTEFVRFSHIKKNGNK